MAHGHPLEYILIVVAIGRFVLCVYCLLDALADLNFLTALGRNGERRLVAMTAAKQEGFQLAAGSVTLLASISFLFLSPPPPNYLELPQSLVAMTAFVLISILHGLSSWSDRRLRRRLNPHGYSKRYTDLEATPHRRASDTEPGLTSSGADIQAPGQP